MPLPQEILRRRTQQDLLRQRQAQLRQKKAEPTQQITPQERAEYEKITQQIEQQKQELKSEMASVTEERDKNMAIFKAMQQSIQKQAIEHPEYNLSGDRRLATQYANKVDELSVRLQILGDSYSVAEASARQAYYGRQVGYEQERVEWERMKRIESLAPTRTPEQLERLRQIETEKGFTQYIRGVEERAGIKLSKQAIENLRRMRAGESPILQLTPEQLRIQAAGYTLRDIPLEGAPEYIPTPEIARPPSFFGDVSEIKVVGLPPTGVEKIWLTFREIESRVARKIKEPIVKLAVSAVEAVTITESLAKETPVTEINLPTPTGQTQITRPVSFEDIDTGVLPPKQNLDLATQKIIFDFNQGRISEEKALEQLESTQKRFILDESKRTAALRFVEGAGIGALTIIAPPIGFTIIGLTGVDALNKRREILNFAKTNPKAAAFQFVAGVTGGFVGAGGVRVGKIGLVKLQDPKVILVGQSKTKFVNKLIKSLEPEQSILIKDIKKTGTRVFKYDIPSPKNKVELIIIEFIKNNKKRFFGIETENGKVVGGVGGKSISKSSGKNSADLFTRSMRFHTKVGLTNLEIAEYLERAFIKTVKSKGRRSISLTESEVRLTKQFKLKGLTPNQVREILRRPLIGAKEAQKRANEPFTQAEFNKASKISKAEILVVEDIVKIRITRLNEQLGPLIAERDSITIKAVEGGAGRINLILDFPKPKRTGVTPKQIGVKGRIKIPVEITDTTEIKVVKGKAPKRTPLAKTFGEETTQILEKNIPQTEKVRLLENLKKKISPIGAFKSIAKRIQQERINLAIKQAKGEVVIKGGAVSLKEIPMAAVGEGLTPEQLFRQRGKAVIEDFETFDISPENLAAQTKAQGLVRFGELDVNRPRISREIGSILDRKIISTRLRDRLNTLIKEGEAQLKKTREKQLILLNQKIALTTRLRERGAITTGQFTILRTALAQRQRQIQKQKQKLIQRKITITTKPPTIPKIPVIIPPLSKKSKEKVMKALKELKGKGVNVLVGMERGRQKILYRDLPPKLALKKAQTYVDRNIQASFLLIPTGKKPKIKDIKKVQTSGKFRPSKRNPLFQVEKKKYRLDMPGEKRQIKRAKRRK